MLMAKGKFRGSNGNNKALISANGAPKGPDVFTKEFKINETPPSGRALPTKGYHSFSGEVIKLEHQNPMNRPSRFTNAPPPLMSLHTGIPSVEKICVGIENAPHGFDLRGRIIGAGGANLLYIRGETGATVTLRGRGSQFIDPVLGSESPEPLHLYIEHPKPEALQNAKQLAINLIQTMQSELQAFIQQQPPPVQQQHVIEAAPIQQIQQAHFQTMNIGTLAQSNVVTIQHQDIIQHPQSSVVTLPATILTATMPGAGGASVPPPGVHIPAQSRPIVPSAQAQELQTIISSPPPVGQVQLIGPPPTINQVQYQIHSGQPVHIQVPASHASSQPVTQMYVMSQPPPSPNFITSSATVSGAVSYVYTQSNVQRLATPPQGTIETVNLQQPPPSAPINITHQPPPPLLHLHFPPPNFPRVAAGQQQYVLQSEESVPPHIQQNPEHHHILQPQFEAQPPQFPLHAPPPASQTFIVPNQEPNHHPPQPMGIINDGPHEAIDQGPPQPVPPPQIVPHPGGNYMPNSMNIPPPNHQLPPQNAPWFNGQQPPQGQFQNGQMQTQVHYSIQTPPHHQFDMRKPELPEDFKGHGVKRRFTDDGPQDAPAFQYGPPHQHGLGNGEAERLQKLMHGPSPRGVGYPGTRNKPLMPPPHPGEKRNVEPRTGLNPGNEPTFGGDNSLPLGPPHGQPPPMPWQPLRMPWMRPPPAPRDEHHVLYPALPTNMPPPQIRPARGPPHVGSQSPTFDHQESAHSAKAPLYNSYPLMQSICNAPPPPPPPAQPNQYHVPVSQGHQQPPVSCPPWMN